MGLIPCWVQFHAYHNNHNKALLVSGSMYVFYDRWDPYLTNKIYLYNLYHYKQFW